MSESACPLRICRLLSQHFLYLSDGAFPGLVLIDGEVLEGFDRRFGRALRLQVGLQDVDVVV